MSKFKLLFAIAALILSFSSFSYALHLHAGDKRGICLPPACPTQ